MINVALFIVNLW